MAPTWFRRRWWAWTKWFSPEQLNNPRVLLRIWLIARGLVFAFWFLLARSTQGDVTYYFRRSHELLAHGPQRTLVEYPTPVIWFLQIPYYLGGRTQTGFLIVFAGSMLALDALFTWSLWRTGRQLRGRAVLFWTLFLMLVGPTAYMRFDLIPAVLGGWALLLTLRRFSYPAGVLVGLGAALKLWPALLWPALLVGNKKQNLRTTLAVFGFGGILAVISLVWGGWHRLLSPLTWQEGRHLQIESVWASIPMFVRLFRPDDFWVGISSFQAFEVWGPTSGTMLALANIATYAGYLIIAACYIVWLLRPHRRMVEAAVLMCMVVLMLIVTNKTFSPQYIMWLGGPLAAGFAILAHKTGDEAEAHRVTPTVAARDERRFTRAGTVLLFITAFTQLIYPIGYAPLVQGTWLMVPVTLVLVFRNLAICWMLLWFLHWIWTFLRHGKRAGA